MEKNRDLFKEAIADARAVKEVSIANAKAALEEVITPRLKSMFEKKLTEMEEEDEKQEEGYEMKKENSEIEEEFNLEELLAELDEVEDEKVHEEEEVTEETVTESEETMEEETHEEEIHEEEETEEEEAEEADEDKEDDSDVEIDFDNMTEEDLRAFIEEVVDEMIEAEELELAEPSEEDEEVEIEDDAEIGDEEEVEIEDEISSLELEEGRINKKQASQLTAALETINTLRSELNEVNLLTHPGPRNAQARLLSAARPGLADSLVHSSGQPDRRTAVGAVRYLDDGHPIHRLPRRQQQDELAGHARLVA